MLDPKTDFNDLNLAESEEAITKTLNYLKHHDPDNANREYAIGFLQYMKRAAKTFAANTDVSLEEFVARYNKWLAEK